MEHPRNKFPDDPVNRIQKLYYDININTIFNRNKLQNVKNKFRKYHNYLNNKYFSYVQPLLLELGCIRDAAYCDWQKEKRKAYMRNPSRVLSEEIEPVFREAHEEYEEFKFEERFYNKAICDIEVKIYEIKKQQQNVYKHYRKCKNCKKMNMVTNCGCESNHKLCSGCSDDIKKCPVCNEELGLLYCAICMENKKEIVETGCENKHQTCKECLDKIIRKNNLCPFCRGCCSKESSVLTFMEGRTSRIVEEVDEMFNSYNRSSFIEEMLSAPDNMINYYLDDYYDRADMRER